MNYIDTHVHLNDEALLNDLDLVIEEAFLNDVKTMFVVGWDKVSSIKAINLAEKYDWCYAIIGFHPCNIRGLTDDDYNWLEKNLKNERVIALGEIGFDLHWDTTTLEEQMIAFRRQVEIAKKVNKPIMIHSRDAAMITLEEVKNTNAKTIGGVLHSYSGSSQMAKEYIKLGFSFGISGPVTFKNGRTMKEVVNDIPLEYLISETDSPYLTPHPYRGKQNGPKYIPLIVDEIARIKGMDVENVKKAILDNVSRIFGVKL